MWPCGGYIRPNRPESGQNRRKPDSFRTESGQNATTLQVISSYSEECKGALFSQFSACTPHPLGESALTSRGIKTPKNRKKMPLGRERRRTKTQFHSTWWFAGWPSSRGKMALIHFAEFCSCMAKGLSHTPPDPRTGRGWPPTGSLRQRCSLKAARQMDYGLGWVEEGHGGH